ncbi:MAG: TIGR04255 family protein, partial [Spirochaetia bacterium]
PEFEWDKDKTEAMIKQKIKAYPNLKEQKESLTQLTPSHPPQQIYSNRWKGFSCQSSDGRNIVQLNMDSFVFSRLNPYENWNKFFSESIRLWAIYNEYAKVKIIRRLGLRFINKLSFPNNELLDFNKYLAFPPSNPDNLELPFTEFFHRDSFLVPNYPYRINIIKALKSNLKIKGTDIIIDIDIFDSSLGNIPEINLNLLKRRFSEMRWLKNKVFFNVVNKEYWESLK